MVSPAADTTTPSAPPAWPGDLALGSFSDDAPWLVDPDAMPWRRRVDAIRWVSRHRVPELVAPRRWPSGTRVLTVLRHLVPAVGAWALGARREGGSASRADLSRRLRIAAEHLGPTYIKLAQFISSGQGLFPPELVHECQLCRDKVGTMALPHWLASYQGRNSARERRWCSPAPATWKIIAFRDRLIRKLYALGLIERPA